MMTRDQIFAMDLVDLSVRIHFAATRLKHHNVSVSYIDLFKSFAATVNQVAKEVAAK